MHSLSLVMMSRLGLWMSLLVLKESWAAIGKLQARCSNAKSDVTHVGLSRSTIRSAAHIYAQATYLTFSAQP